MYRRYNHLLGGGREGIIVSHVWSVVLIYAGSLELVLHDGMEVTYKYCYWKDCHFTYHALWHCCNYALCLKLWQLNSIKLNELLYKKASCQVHLKLILFDVDQQKKMTYYV